MATDAAARIAVAGETLVDVLADGDDARPRPGGGPANTAVALARLGVPVRLLARFADDDFGRLLRHHVEGNGVDTSLAVAAAGRSSSARVRRRGDGSANYEFDIDGTVDWGWTPDELPALSPSVVAVHSGSLALARSRVLEEWLRQVRTSATVSIDPNLRPQLVTADTRSQVERWVGFADLVKVSADDLDLVFPGERPHDVARRWAGSGPALVVVTAGAMGATAFFSGGEVHRDALPVDVADTIGAGDAFTAGLLQSLLEHDRLGARVDELTREDVEAALGRATVVAGLTCTRVGADPPTLEVVRARE